MKLIKLDAIDSTNDFLKGLAQNQHIENYTVVTAKTQTKGKGQHGTQWHDEYNKNLITSILIKETLTTIEGIFVLNIAVTLGILAALQKNKIPSLSVKWPNDIMSDNKKIAGILIENLIQENGKIQSIIGIGLNVNQTEFNNLPKASSLKGITRMEYDIQDIVIQIVEEIKKKVALISDNKSEILWEEYQQNLFKKGIPVVLENQKGLKFMGIIQGVNRNGKLQVLLEDDSIQEYGIKEVSLIF
ncbi:biotin--[acetyl-CoA-carboxylase] ligase [Flavobacterium luminosum]|uniref:Biotin--[acetyl-CoA-carboxylase] ligase n=1 Tax=Flavobacterium luminosum TaxID=2949086 RepID=A0ABT0TM60_9FLAO|nr:biotin--[acetyl-CoA-carboxylase] ligase [Flavobacterium sp. HXWNR70]MCL9808581.1 biotin--[acetyl-CoA-carboxylase] ligase [Flavobacterium sp. HXWNR70]